MHKSLIDDFITGLAGQVLASPLRLPPFSIQQAVVEQVLNGIFRRQVRWGDLDFLAGRSIVLEIADLGWRWPVTLEHGRIRVRRQDIPGDATLRGRAGAFALLAGGQAEPDALFFQRRLAVEGDTDLALALKNFLDSVDIADLLPPCIAAIANRIHRRLAARWR